jgi:CubicO group peptidase (beta-lactamase class C family)
MAAAKHPPAKRILPPSVLAVFHLSADETTREVNGSLPLDARFPVASVTKTLVALLAARLCHDGVVAWDEPLPVSDDGHAPASLRTLLHHAAGVPFELDPAHWGPTSLTEPEVTSALVRPPRLPLPPGTWHYSNLGYAMAARILESATGQDLSALLTDRLLRPLGMSRTSFPDERTEGPLLGAGAPAGGLCSTLGDLMKLARAIDGRRPDVVTWPMLALLLEAAIPDDDGTHLGAGIRTHAVRHHRLLVSTGTIGDRTTCVAVWPRRGASVLVAEAGHDHGALWRTAARRWQRDDAPARRWWWDGQEVVQLQDGDRIDLVLRETTWPFALFCGQARGQRLVGVDWRGEPLELLDRGEALVADGITLTADVADSAAAAIRP